MLYTRGSRFRSCISLTWRAARGRRPQVESSAMQSYSYRWSDLKTWRLQNQSQTNQTNQTNQSLNWSYEPMWGATGDRLKEGACWDLVDLDSKRWSEAVLKVRRSTCHFLPWEMWSMHSRRRAREAGYLSGQDHKCQPETESKTTPQTILLRRSTRALPRLQIDTLTAGFTRRKLLHCHLASIH